MAKLNATQTAELEAIALALDDAVTWMSGNRARRMVDLRDRVRAIAAGETPEDPLPTGDNATKA